MAVCRRKADSHLACIIVLVVCKCWNEGGMSVWGGREGGGRFERSSGRGEDVADQVGEGSRRRGGGIEGRPLVLGRCLRAGRGDGRVLGTNFSYRDAHAILLLFVNCCKKKLKAIPQLWTRTSKPARRTSINDRKMKSLRKVCQISLQVVLMLPM